MSKMATPHSTPRPQYKECACIVATRGLEFGFALCYRPRQLGPVNVGHFWMDTRTLYGQRKTAAPNLQPMADFFWHSAVLEGHHRDPGVQESYLLAHLCPLVRSTGSRKVMADARLWTAGGSSALKLLQVQELEKTLSSALRRPAPEQLMTMSDFHARSAEVLGIPRPSEAERNAYRSLSEELFGPARAILADPDRSPGAACDAALAQWRSMTKRIGRRGEAKWAAAKKAMDLLSYEARAAVHRCYSHTWMTLIPTLVNKHGLSLQTARFLHLMHTERITESTSGTMGFHLFNGHLFALHPAMSSFMQTPTGQQLLGEFLEASTAEEQVTPFQRLLKGIYLSLFCYTGSRDDRKQRGQQRQESKAAKEIATGRPARSARNVD